MRHQRRDWSDPLRIVVVIEADIPAEFERPLFVLLGECIKELPARTPQKPNAEFPGRFRARVEILRLQFQVLEEMPGKCRRRAFAHPDHANVRTADDANT